MRNELDSAAVYVYSSKANSVANVVDWFIDDIGAVPSAEDGGKVIAFGERLPVYRLAVVLHRISSLTVCGFEALTHPTTITRRCLAAEFEAEGTNSADKPLTHEEGDTNYLQGANSAGNTCSGSGHGLTGPGWWFVKFRDGKKHKVSKIRLWNRAGCCPDRLNGACVRFATDNSVKPPTADPSQNCDDYLLDEIASNSGPGSGTWLRVDRWIVGMMLVSRAADYYITLCGIEIYEHASFPTLFPFDAKSKFTPSQTDLSHDWRLVATKPLLSLGQTANGYITNDEGHPVTCSQTSGDSAGKWWEITSKTDDPGAEFDAVRLYPAINYRIRLSHASVYVYSSKASHGADSPDWSMADIGDVPPFNVDGGKVIPFSARLP
eukprot:g12453.t1